MSNSLIETLAEPQLARAELTGPSGLGAVAEVRVSPAGLIAIGVLVSAILLSVPPIIRAARERCG